MNTRHKLMCLVAAVAIASFLGIYTAQLDTQELRGQSDRNSSGEIAKQNPENHRFKKAAKDSAAADLHSRQEVITEKEAEKVKAVSPVWQKRFKDAELFDTKLTAVKQKVGIKRNIRTVVRESLIKTDMKYPNLVVEEVYHENENGDLSLVSYVEYVADHLMVKIDSDENVKKLQQDYSALEVSKIGDDRLFKVKLNGEDIDTVKNAISEYEKSGTVQYAEKDYVMSSSSNDSYYSNLWGMNNTGQSGGTADADIDAPEGWAISKGSKDVLVAVIDTGIDYNHPDLSANMWTNPGETGTDANGNDKSTNGIDDDNNGYVDDFRGWDFYNNDNDPMDDHSHGTHCAGTIGAAGDNNVGVIGVSPNVSLVGLKFLSGGGSGYTSDAIQAVLYHNKIGVDISSNSWGGGGYSQALKDAIDAAASRNILFVAAAGNSGLNTDNSTYYPCGYDSANVMSIAATDHNDNIASFSNYGVTSVDMGAPGVSILSTTPNSGYRFFSGTSMATPHVSGAAALLKSVSPSMSYADMKYALMYKGDSISSLSGKTVSGNRLNIHKLLGDGETPEPAYISSPVNGSEFTSADITFTWQSNSNVSQLNMMIGTSFGSSDLYLGEDLSGTSVSVNLPEDGSRLYVRLSSLIDGEWYHRDTSYIASDAAIPPPAKSELTYPVAGTVLKSGRIDFKWTVGSQVERRYLYVGSRQGYANIYCGWVGEAGVSLNLNFFTEKTYVRLWSRLEGRWQYIDYVFDSESNISVMTSPTDGTKLTSASVDFQWTEGSNIYYRYLMVGSYKGYSDIYRSYVYGTSKKVLIPTDGRTIYVRLWSYVYGAGWHYKDYSYKTPVIAPEISKFDSHEDGAIFDSTNVKLTWTEGVGVKYNYLYIYSNKTYRYIYGGFVSNNEVNVTIPEGSGQLTAYLYSYINGRWERLTYIFYAKGSAPQIYSPVNGSTLYSDSVTFKWNNPSGVRYNYMYVGTRPGGNNLYSGFLYYATSKTLNLNVSGKVYVRLWTYNNGWSYTDSVYYK